MGLKLVDLLRWSREVTLRGSDGKPIEKDGKPIVVWLRIIGDQDLEDSYKAARAASARHRATLRDKNSDDYLSGISIIHDADADACKNIIISTRRRDFNSMAYANVERPDLPKIDEIAIDADAPTLEEQEKFDALVEKISQDYLKALDDYVQAQVDSLQATLDATSLDEIRAQAEIALVDIQALEVFIKELELQKVYKAVYTDKYFKEHAFDNIEDFKQFKLKDQMISEYDSLELSPDDLKN